MKDLHTQQVPVDRNMKSIVHLAFSAELVTNFGDTSNVMKCILLLILASSFYHLLPFILNVFYNFPGLFEKALETKPHAPFTCFSTLKHFKELFNYYSINNVNN